jgi:hypothetical protein
MSGEERKDEGYEARDAHAGSTLRAGLLLLVAMFLVAAIVIPLYRLLARQEAREQPRPASMIPATPAPAAGPLLVTDEPSALAAFRAKEDAILDGYAWVEKDQGIARMPIAEAMRIVGARRALPEFPAPAPSPAAPGVAAPGGAR